MKPGVCDLEGTRGDDFEHAFVFVDDGTSNPLNVSSWTIAAQLRLYEDAVPFVAFTVDMTAAATGTVIIRIAKAVMATLGREYVWDFQRTLAGKDWTLFGGTFTVDLDVTR